MPLEEKIAALPPRLRDQVEDYVDYLLNKEEPGEINEPSHTAPGSEASGICGMAGPDSGGITGVQRDEDTRTVSSGIILAEEQVPDPLSTDYVDFADINSRFGHQPEKDEDHREPGRLRRLLDWM